MKKTISLLFSLLFISTLSFGQYYYLKQAAPGQNPGGLNADDEFPGADASWTNILGPSVTTATWSAIQTLPFGFNFNGAPVTQYKVSSTGVVTFTTGAAAVPSVNNVALPSASIPDKSVCVWGIEASGTNDEIMTKTFGTAPNRQQWVFFTSHSLNGGWSYWSIVMEETSDMIYIVDQRHNGTTGGVTAGIQIDASTAVSVLGSPALLPEAGTDPTSADNVYYEFTQGVQPADDVELTTIINLPYAAAGNLNITGVLTNLGANTITDLTISYDAGSGIQNDVLSGLNIPSTGTYNFSHATPLLVAAGTNYTVNIDVTLTNDVNVADNSGSVVIGGLTQVPAKTVVGEEKTGTWCGFCPRGAVGLAGMEATSDFIGIAVHNSDPMAIANYDAGTANLHPDFTGYPHGAVDRVIGGDPGSFNTMHPQRAAALVPCDVKNIVATLNQSTGQISVSADSEFYGTVTGEYRMSCVIVEDDIMTTGNGWTQVNYYDGGGYGLLTDPVTGFEWSTAGDPVSALDFGGYDHVARTLSNNDILGDAGSISMNPSIGLYSHNFADVAGTVVNNIAKSHAVVMVVNASTGEILNAGKSSISVVTSANELVKTEDLVNIYPNPTADVSLITFSLDGNTDVKMEVVNVLGEVVFSKNAGIMSEGAQKLYFDGSNLTSGIYFVNLIIGDKFITKKVSLRK
jgi:hypothetical protein